jgi:hypothetical protein
VSAFIELTGVQQPLRADLFLPSTADAGTIVIDAGAPIKMPSSLEVRLSQVNRTFRWQNCRLVKTPQWHWTFVRFVLEDERWKLRTTIMDQSYNEYGLGGVINKERTAEQLWQDIATASGLSIVTQNLPDIKPPANWTNRNARDCANEMLRLMACRMVYDPEQQHFVVSPAGSGQLPNLLKRWRRPVINEKPEKVVVRTGQILYESAIDIVGHILNANGQFEEMEDVHLENFFAGYETEDLATQTAWRSTAFRVWKVVSADHPRQLDAEEIVIVPVRSIQSARPHIEGANMTYMPRVHPIAADRGIATTDVRFEIGSEYAYSMEPVVRLILGTPWKQAKLVTCYYALDNGVADRDSKEADVAGGEGPEEVIEAEFLKPVDSDQPDAHPSATAWEATAQAIADAHAAKWSADAQQATLGGLHNTNGSGQVGAVRYRVALTPRRAFETSFAFNYTPRFQV